MLRTLALFILVLVGLVIDGCARQETNEWLHLSPTKRTSVLDASDAITGVRDFTVVGDTIVGVDGKTGLIFRMGKSGGGFRSFGRLGEAPGESVGPGQVFIAGDTLFVVDFARALVQSFGPDDHLISAINFSQRISSPAGVARAPDSGFYLATRGPDHFIYRTDADGDSLSSFAGLAEPDIPGFQGLMRSFRQIARAGDRLLSLQSMSTHAETWMNDALADRLDLSTIDVVAERQHIRNERNLTENKGMMFVTDASCETRLCAVAIPSGEPMVDFEMNKLVLLRTNPLSVAALFLLDNWDGAEKKPIITNVHLDEDTCELLAFNYTDSSFLSYELPPSYCSG